jgi:hypothetical protein
MRPWTEVPQINIPASCFASASSPLPYANLQPSGLSVPTCRCDNLMINFACKALRPWCHRPMGFRGEHNGGQGVGCQVRRHPHHGRSHTTQLPPQSVGNHASSVDLRLSRCVDTSHLATVVNRLKSLGILIPHQLETMLRLSFPPKRR